MGVEEKPKEEYVLENRWEKRIKGMEGIMVLLLIWSFFMLFTGFLLGALFIAAGG